jgi:L-alanine-DL-glutamate epimerase-like enolase superfamily enzyme
MLRLDDGQGHTGWGEASPLEDYSPDDLDSARRVLDHWAARWAGGEVDGMDSDQDFLATPSARCAADVALLDLRARQLGVPLRAVLLDIATPSRPVERVPVCALVSLPGVERPGAPAAPTDFLNEVEDRVRDGFEVVKFKVGGGHEFSRQLDQLSAVRAEFPRLVMRLDANGSWTPEEAPQRLLELEAAIHPELVEQPVGAAELLTFGGSPVPLAADESLRLPDSVAAITRSGACTAVVLKPMVLGGPQACLSLARIAHANGARAIVSHTFGGPVAHAASCELALAMAAIDPIGPPIAVGLAGHDDLEQRAGPWIEPKETQGHGVEVRR